MDRVKLVLLISTIAVLGVFVTSASAFQPSESATYVGSQSCLGCHNATTGPALGTMDASGWQQTLHANIYREVTTETMIGNFKSPPVAFKVGDATLTVSFDDGGGSGPWTMTLQGAGFGPTTYTVHRAHGGFEVADNADPVLPDTPGRRKWIGKQRYHTKIGQSYYILPAQWNPRPDRDGGSQGWVDYHSSDWMNNTGALILANKASEERRCMGCHQVGAGPTVDVATGEYVLAEADNPSFWNIGCESCHGPGSEHVGAGGRGPIVNPKNLTIAQQNEVCGACHLRPTGHPIPNGDAAPGYPYNADLGGTYFAGRALAGYIAKDSGGYWPDGTSKQHHQQYSDYQKSAHFDKLSCMTCHTAHNETSAEHDLVRTARDNSLCTQCHAAYTDEAALAKHSNHRVDLSKGLGRCVDCHMPAVQKSGVNYDIHAHTFKVISPQTTIDTQADGGTPNSCAASCHGTGLLGSPTFGFVGKLGTWNEAVDVSLAQRLLQPTVPDVGPVTPIHRAVVIATLTNNGAAVSGASVGSWHSIPLNGGVEQTVALPVGARAEVEKGSGLTFALLGNSPNPFNPETHIGYQIPESGDVFMAIYNSIGQQVRVLVSEHQDSGEYSVNWNGKDDIGRQVASGIYFYKLKSGSYEATRRMVMLK
ncbi:MAG: multiheme c-type cytochrome [bacterium]|nr:multiheme c-type cytochrome [bacterium]